MKKSEPVIVQHRTTHATLGGYVIGFLLSVYLTITAYIITVNDSMSTIMMAGAVLGLALVQFFAQAWFFLHIGREQKPRWNLLAFAFMTMVVLIVVLGSIWIMTNLDYHHGRSPTPSDQSLIEDEGVQP